MILTENIYFLILFTLPAALYVIYHSHIRHVPQVIHDKSVELAECAVFCLCVFFINLLIMHKEMVLFAEYMLADDKYQYCALTGFRYFEFIINYFVLNLLVSIGVIVLWYAGLARVFRWIRNKVNRESGRLEELPFSDVWRNLFEIKSIVDTGNCVLKIEKSGVTITAGILSVYSAPHLEHKEVLLTNSDFVKELFEGDKDKPVKERVFPQAICEYYDMNQDVLLKFYSLDGYDKYCEEESEPD
jgi:hypothetical protein